MSIQMDSMKKMKKLSKELPIHDMKSKLKFEAIEDKKKITRRSSSEVNNKYDNSSKKFIFFRLKIG